MTEYSLLLNSLYGNDFLKNSLCCTGGTGLSQTILLSGVPGSGKMTLSVILAAALLCFQPKNGSACGHCSSCKKIITNNHPDLFILDRQEAEIPVAAARELQQWAVFLPNDSDRKVAILRHSQNMNRSAQNALLKLLEEPPQSVHFILTCESTTALLPTILSRCTKYALSPLSQEEMQQALDSRFPLLPPEQIQLALARADGILGKAITILQTSSTSVAETLVRSVADALAKKQESLLYSSFSSAGKVTRDDFSEFFQLLSHSLHHALCLQNNRAVPLDANKQALIQALAHSLTSTQLIQLYDYCFTLYDRTQFNAGISNLTGAACVGFSAILAGQAGLLQQFEPLGGYELG